MNVDGVAQASQTQRRTQHGCKTTNRAWADNVDGVAQSSQDTTQGCSNAQSNAKIAVPDADESAGPECQNRLIGCSCAYHCCAKAAEAITASRTTTTARMAERQILLTVQNRTRIEPR
jgi:hypothetical protein